MGMIACLAWGSLTWDPRMLPVRQPWCTDGPQVEVEFARQSRDGRITLVMVPTGLAVRCLWAVLEAADRDAAVAALGEREGIPPEWSPEYVGVWSAGQEDPAQIPALSEWARERRLQHVVWTALPPRFDGVDRMPSAQQVLAYLSSLEGIRRDNAERYIRRAPAQVATPYRRQIEAMLGWTPEASVTQTRRV